MSRWLEVQDEAKMLGCRVVSLVELRAIEHHNNVCGETSIYPVPALAELDKYFNKREQAVALKLGSGRKNQVLVSLKELEAKVLGNA